MNNKAFVKTKEEKENLKVAKSTWKTKIIAEHPEMKGKSAEYIWKKNLITNGIIGE